MKKLIIFIAMCFFVPIASLLGQTVQNATSFKPGELWPDDKGVHINAHGGGILFHNGKYYWFGEHKGDRNSAEVGVTCYSSGDLYNWKNEGIALEVSDDTTSLIVRGCTLERPKVIYNEKTGKFVMYFHLELRGRGYSAAYAGRAVSDKVTGPYTFIDASRVNAGIWPMNLPEEGRTDTLRPSQIRSNNPGWRDALANGLYVRRDFEGGQMSRDMTLYVDDDGKAYHIYAAEENYTLNLAELTDDYLGYTGRYITIDPAGHNEAPAIFKKNGKYFMITSGCTGWDPNAARLFSAPTIWGPWKRHPNPCVGEDADLTFHSQSTYILPVQGKKDAFIFMADRWTPDTPIDGRYIWLPILFNDGLPVLKWFDEWNFSIFDQINADPAEPKAYTGWNLVWSDEFNYSGAPDPACWSYEYGFVRNNEHQWYQPQNAAVGGGVLTIQGRVERVYNTSYDKDNRSWQRNRPYADYTSACIKTRGMKEFRYGRFEIRAKIPTGSGSWPAIWTLGNSMGWPNGGEIDIMEYYLIRGVPSILANVAWGSDTKPSGEWRTKTFPYSKWTGIDPHWGDKFHIWRMDWDEQYIRLYLDDELLNEVSLNETINGERGQNRNPFKQPHYILLNLALGGNNGGPIDNNAFPMDYEVDYVRVYQKK